MARKKIAPSAAISQNQSIAAPTAKASDGREQRRVELAAGAAARRARRRSRSRAASRPWPAPAGRRPAPARRTPRGRASGRRGRVSGSRAAGPRRTGRCRRRGRASGSSPKASSATRQNSSRPGAGEVAEALLGFVRELQVGAGELVPGAAADGDRRRRSRPAPHRPRPASAPSGRGRAPPRARPGRPARRSSRRSAGEQQRAPARSRRAGSASTVRPWSTAAGLSMLSARPRRSCTASTAGSAPSAPIARVASSQRRSWERASRHAAGDEQRQQAAARVGEVEGQQERRQRGDRDPAQGGGQRAPAEPEDQRRADPEGDAVGVPVAERVAQPRARAERSGRRGHTGGAGGWPGASTATECQANCDAFSETLAPLVGLGDQECGKEDPEVDQNPVRLGHAQLDRTRPERRDCRKKRQPQISPPAQ